MRQWIAPILAAFISLTHSAASAQQTYGPDQLTFYEYVTRRFVDCFAERRRDGIRTWLATLPGTRAERAVYRQLANDFRPCWQAGSYMMPAMQFTPSELRYRFASHYLKRHDQSLPAAFPLSETSVAWFEAALAALATDAPVDRKALLEQNLAFCLARTHWLEVVRFYAAGPATPEEREALQSLTPHLTGCVPAGLSVEVTAQNLRGALAEGLYHILLDPPPTQSRSN